MAELAFENLNFSFLIEPENRIAYLQEWQNGNWSEPEKFDLPQEVSRVLKQSRLARAVRDFRRQPEYVALCEALGSAVEVESSFAVRFRDRLVGLIYA